ncbi:MAG: AAA family ATPase, partial [Treponema sp.]|nr:AAA family ATPase [Treponema sp.]
MPENKIKYFKPVIETLKEFGGSATPKQVEEKIKQKLNLPSNIVNEFHEKSGNNKFSNDVAWARQYLVWAGYIDSSERGIWTLTDSGKAVDMTEEFATNIYKRYNKKNKSNDEKDSLHDEEENKEFEPYDEKDSLHDEEENKEFEPYDENDFLSEVFISQEKYETMVGLLKRKKNIIIQGAPGVGKSFAAKRLAYSIIGEKNTSRVKLVQFHQSYSYEDFIVGFRPSEKENVQFEKKYGVFHEFCEEARKKAIDDIENKYFFI